MRIEAEIEIAAPIALIWDVVTNPELSPLWNPNVIAIHDFSGLPIRKGSSWTQVVRILGRQTPLHAEVTDCLPPYSGTVELDGPGQPVVSTTLRQDGNTTVVRQVMELSESGIGGFAIRLAGPTIRRELEEALRRQKERAEAGT